ncbi:histidine--tRNA ligase [Buchnera aphidicola (Mindarus keteleerifoliae)]|uniref:histidine--tRNA ligase n=1 Tax=Buchnera aphidicola TaxID=9 RepID=UPI0031B6B54E
MNGKIQIVRGMHDLIPTEVIEWNLIENIFKKVLINYCYDEIRFPIIEKKMLFKKSIGTVTDIFEKEIYSFKDKSKNEICLRPEGTASCVRASLNHGLIYKKKQRLWYIGPMFRYERPQKGRYRQFYQLGIEVFGYLEPEIDLEIILLNISWWKKLNIEKYLTLEINTIGSIEDREKYQKALIKFLSKKKSVLDQQSKNRLFKNPLRILDSKNKKIQEILISGPKLFDFLSKKSILRFNFLCKLLDSINIKYKINNNLVRGLDYYNDTVFEWKCESFNLSQNTICAGGRYDNLVEKIGGYSTPAIGCAVGMERILFLRSLILNKSNSSIIKIDVYIVFFDKNLYLECLKLSQKIRKKFGNIKTLLEISFVTKKNYLKKASKLNSRFCIVVSSIKKNEKNILVKDLKKNVNLKCCEQKLLMFLEREYYSQ